jgi:hypothetical protein
VKQLLNMMTRLLSILTGLIVLATSANAQIDIEGLLDLLPEPCLLLVQSAIIPCFTSNPECLTSLPTAEEIEMLPAAEEIMSCDDISEPVCPVLAKCEPCIEEMGDLLSCVLTNAEDIPQETVDLINGCAFDCEGIGNDMNMTANTTSPVATTETVIPTPGAPISAPPQAAPTSEDTPSPSSVIATGTPPPSTAATTTVSLGIVGVIAALSSFMMA